MLFYAYRKLNCLLGVSLTKVSVLLLAAVCILLAKNTRTAAYRSMEKLHSPARRIRGEVRLFSPGSVWRCSEIEELSGDTVASAISWRPPR